MNTLILFLAFLSTTTWAKPDFSQAAEYLSRTKSGHTTIHSWVKSLNINSSKKREILSFFEENHLEQTTLPLFRIKGKNLLIIEGDKQLEVDFSGLELSPDFITINSHPYYSKDNHSYRELVLKLEKEIITKKKVSLLNLIIPEANANPLLLLALPLVGGTIAYSTNDTFSDMVKYPFLSTDQKIISFTKNSLHRKIKKIQCNGNNLNFELEQTEYPWYSEIHKVTTSKDGKEVNWKYQQYRPDEKNLYFSWALKLDKEYNIQKATKVDDYWSKVSGETARAIDIPFDTLSSDFVKLASQCCAEHEKNIAARGGKRLKSGNECEKNLQASIKSDSTNTDSVDSWRPNDSTDAR